MKLSPRQQELLGIIADGSESWGDAWTHYDNGHNVGLDFRNFDKVADALQRRGLVTNTNGDIALTAVACALLRMPMPPKRVPPGDCPTCGDPRHGGLCEGFEMNRDKDEAAGRG